MKILIIDDSADALDVAKVRLAKEGLDILCAEGGVAGLEVARRENPDLILLDLDMPDMSGFDVCRSLKADPELCMIPVLFLSGSGTAEDKVKGLDLGAVDYITKPFDTFELRARVRAALRTKHLQDLLIEHAHIDPLTGLPNRRALMERLRYQWARIGRHGGQLSFIMADIDHFKRVNDVHGHQIGDKMLQEVADVIARQCREVDLPARYGGEEFAIVVPDETTSGATCLAERCREEIAKVRLAVNGETVAVTASFGVADANNLPSLEALMKRADEALYRAKQAGRNLVRSYDEDATIPADIGLASGDTTMDSGNIAGHVVSGLGSGHDK
jgi:diguanylate cyclase (GGDEF)-like protein